MSTPLPFDAARADFVRAVHANPIVIGVADTGAGKSTRGPRFLLDEGYRIVVTQPRRLAARSVAERVADELGEPLGQSVGYELGGGERRLSGRTRLRFTTDGLALVRELMGHAGRRDILCIDEVHEWNKHVEILVAWFRREIENGAPFKLVLLSATLEAERLSQFLFDAPIIRVPGRLHPITEQPRGATMIDDAVRLLREGRNVLVFVPGKAEINQTLDAIRATGVDAELLPLHGELDPAEQARCFASYRRKKCIVATNVAQTSVTIADIDAVVDSGLERRTEVVEGVEGLYLKPISRADGQQRRGRAGRTRPGIYVDHCPSGERPEFPVAEILRTRLDQTVLRLAEAGVDMESIDFFHQPPKDEIRRAKSSLFALGCFARNKTVTDVGREVSKLPVSVQSARMIVAGAQHAVLDEMLTVAAIIEAGGITDRKSDAWKAHIGDETESDLLAQLNLFRLAHGMSGETMKAHGLNEIAVRRARTVRRQLVDDLGGPPPPSTGDRNALLRSIATGMVERLYRRDGKRFLGDGEEQRSLSRSSIVNRDSVTWVVAMPFDRERPARDERAASVSRELQLVTVVTPETLIEIAPHLVRRHKHVAPVYDPVRDTVLATNRVTFRGRVVSEEQVPAPARTARQVFASWVASSMS